jgi:hypothetical protein
MFLLPPAKVDELFGPGTEGTRPGEEVLLDGNSTSATSIMFHAHLTERTRKGHQTFLPRNDGTLSAIQLPLLGKQLFLQLDSHRMQRRRSPTPINKQKISLMTKKQA